MICSIHQLHYLPWVRYFNKIVRSDLFVLLDDVQFNKNGWQNRNKIKHSQGWMYLTVPIIHRFPQSLYEVRIDNHSPWASKHWKSLLTYYSPAPYFRRYEKFFQETYNRKWERLIDLNYHILSYLLGVLKIKTKIIFSSQLKVKGEGTERLVNICKAVGADTYLSGAYAAEVYLDKALLEREGVKLILQNWHCPSYRQQFPQLGFIPDLSVVDLLCNEGERSMEVILRGGEGKEKE